ncbi:MAG: TRAP transporter small permease [Chloroflexi bacterium]|nr:TRAP transporter small permease [Chloroflexota bacterium]
MTSETLGRLIEKFKQVNYWLLSVPVLALFAMFFLDAANVTTIRLFGVRATPIQKELIEQLIILVVFLALTYVLLGPGHIKTDIIRNHLNRPLRFAAEMISDVTTLLFALFCTWTTGAGTLYTIQVKAQTMGIIQLSLAPFYVAITLSFALLAIGSLLVLIRHIMLFREGRYPLPAAGEARSSI